MLRKDTFAHDPELDGPDDPEEEEEERDGESEPSSPQRSSDQTVSFATEPLFAALLRQSVQKTSPGDVVLNDFATFVAAPLSARLAHKTAKGGDFVVDQREAGYKEEMLSRYSADQSMRAHLVNGLFPVAQIARTLVKWDVWRFTEYFDETAYRLFCAGYTLHDWVKLPEVDDELKRHGLNHQVNPATDLPIVERIVGAWCKELGLDRFLEPIGGLEACLHDLILIISNTQRKSGTMNNLGRLPGLNPHSQQQTQLATDLSTLADYLAYLGRTPVDVVNHPSIRRQLAELSNNTARLTYHHIADVRGVVTNLINNATLRACSVPGAREPLLYAPSGVVYLERPEVAPDLPSIEAIADQTIENIRGLCRDRLFQNLTGFQRDGKGLKYAPYYDLFFAPNQFPSLIARGAQKRTEGKASAAVKRFEKLQAAKMVPTGGSVEGLPTEDSVDMVAEGLALIESVMKAELDPAEVQLWLLDQLGVADLDAQVTEIPTLGRTGGVPYQWYYAVGVAHQRQPGQSRSEWEERLQTIATNAGNRLTDQVMGQGWLQLREYIISSLRFERSASAVEQVIANAKAELERYQGARRGSKATPVCSLCSSAYSISEQREAAVLFAPMVYTNKLALHGSKATRNICAICELEMMLRQLLMNRSNASGKKFEGRRLRYLFFYPTYFFTPETLDILREVQLQLQRMSFTTLRKLLVPSIATASINLDLGIFQYLEDLLLNADINPDNDSMFRLRFSENDPLTFAFIGIPPTGRDAKEAEAWIHPAFLALVMPLLLDVKVVASESMLPLFNEATELPETVAFDGAHAFVHYLAHTGRPGMTPGRLNLDQVGRALQRLTAAYLVHLDGNSKTGGGGYDYRWHEIAPLARNIDSSPLYAFAYLKKWQRRASHDGLFPNKAALYLDLYNYLDLAPRQWPAEDESFAVPGGVTMSHAKELTHLYRQFYRAERISKSNAILRPIAVAAEVIIEADPRLFPCDEGDTSPLTEAVRGKLHSFVENVSLGRADGRLPKGSNRESRDAAIAAFSDYFVREIFLNALGGNRAELRGKQLNLLKNACEVLYLDQWRHERNEDRVEDTAVDGAEEPTA